MSGQDTSEEKNLPPTERTLRKARERGQVASSSDFVTAVVTIGAMICVGLMWPIFVRLIDGGLQTAVNSMDEDFRESYPLVLYDSIIVTAIYLTPIFAVVFSLAVLANILHKGGIPFSFHPVKPNFGKLNPASGFKRIFGVRSITEFSVSFARLCLWFVVVCLLIWFDSAPVLNSAACHLKCVLTAGLFSFLKLVLAATLLLVLAALLDIPMQVALFRREMKMTRSQLKQETKDTQGSPEIRNKRKELHREILQAASRPSKATGKAATPNLVVHGGGMAIAMFFDYEVQKVPLIMAKGKGNQATQIVDSAKTLDIPIELDPALAAKLFRGTNIGEVIPEAAFESVAEIIIKNGML